MSAVLKLLFSLLKLLGVVREIHAETCGRPSGDESLVRGEETKFYGDESSIKCIIISDELLISLTVQFHSLYMPIQEENP